MKKQILSPIILEPLAHLDGHYFYFLEKIANLIKTKETFCSIEKKFEHDVLKPTPLLGFKTIKFLNCIDKLMSFLKFKSVKRVIYIDIITTFSIYALRKKNNLIIVNSTFYFLPYLFVYLFLKKKKIIFYRFTHLQTNNELFNFLINKLSSKLADKIYFQSSQAHDEFFLLTQKRSNLLPIPINLEKKDVQTYNKKKIINSKNLNKINLLIFGINHINKDLECLVCAVRNLKNNNFDLFNRLKINFIGKQIKNENRVTSDDFHLMGCNIESIKNSVSEQQKSEFYLKSNIVFCGFKKNFTGSSGTLVDSLNYSRPAIINYQNDFYKFLKNCKSIYSYESESSNELYNVLKNILKNGVENFDFSEDLIPDLYKEKNFYNHLIKNNEE